MSSSSELSNDNHLAHSTNHRNSVLSFDMAQDVIAKARGAGLKIGLCHGCFDIFHYGHLRHLESASKMCDFLAVSVTTDRFIRKGKNRPVFKDQNRAEVLAGLACVNVAVISDYPTAIHVMKSLKPNIFFKGQEYETMEDGANPSFEEEKQLAAVLGIDVVFTKEERFSSTRALERLWMSKNE